MSLDYYVELDNTAAGVVDQAVDQVTTRYFRSIADGNQTNDLREQWVKSSKKVSLAPPTAAFWEWIARPSIDLALLPPGSFWLRFSFRLAKPYFSRDDRAFYIIDNPVVRDKVFKLPIVRPTNWKGSLRAALWQMGHAAEDDPQIRRLFGETRGDEGGRAGRLFFHPTFFDTTGLEVINPHDRVRRVGKNPILFESVPRDTAGTFTLLYVPFDLLGTERNPNAQAGDDLPLIAAGIRAMFRGHGFSAKRTSGFGVAKESVEEGFIEMRVEESVPVEMANPASKGPAQPLAKYLVAPGRLKAEYLNSDGTFRERGQAELTSKTARQEYEKAKKWWEREGKALAAESQLQTQPPPIELPPQKRWLRREFRSFDELVRTAEEIGSQLGKNESERS